MNFNDVISTLNKLLLQKKPESFNSSWILEHAPHCYRYIQKNIRTEFGTIDWDKVTAGLNRDFQKLWVRYRRKVVKQYKSKREVDLVLKKNKDKLYTFISFADEKDSIYRDRILISLVRLSQKGNVLAQRELVDLLKYTVDDWVDRYYYLRKWKGYTDDVEDKIKGCIRCYKYTGSFLGYLYKTLEYSGRGIAPIQKYSLDDLILDGAKRKIDNIGYDPRTDEIKIYS